MADPIETQNDSIVTKHCPKCCEQKAVSEFSLDQSQRDGCYSICRPCANAYKVARYHKNLEKSREQARRHAAAARARDPEGLQAYKRAWCEANPDKVAEYRAKPVDVENRRKVSKAWRDANIEKVRADKRAYYAANKERMLALGAVYREENAEILRERVRAYSAANPDKIRVKCANRRARKKASGGKHTVEDIKFLMKVQGGKCAHAWCRVSLKNGKHTDHIIPLSLGGSNDRGNIQLLCQFCNISKGNKHPIDLAQSKGLLL